MSGNMKMLRIYASNTDKIGHASFYEEVAFAAKKNGMAGLTVYKGIMGYGSSSQPVSPKLWEMNEKTPVVIELIDAAAKIEMFMPELNKLIARSTKGCLVVCLEVEAIVHKTGVKSLN